MDEDGGCSESHNASYFESSQGQCCKENSKGFKESYEYFPGTTILKGVDISKIKFIKAIGKGSFGAVYKAIWDDKYVAVKVVETENEVLAFGNEIKHLLRVKHENIIQMFGTGTSASAKCIIMEFASDGSLFDFLHRPPYHKYDLSIALSWLLQCAKAISYLHGMQPKPLIHRDLKPLNMLLMKRKRLLKLCDFGTACDLRSVMTDNRGSTAWMAPEVIKGSNYDEKCDVYSWGMILWEVLTRRIPFEDLGQMYRILWQVVNQARPPLIQGCPKPLEWLLKRCWLDKQCERPSMQDVIEMIAPLYKLMSSGEDFENLSLSDESADCSITEGALNGIDRLEATPSNEIQQCVSDHAHTLRKSNTKDSNLGVSSISHYSADDALMPTGFQGQPFNHTPRPMVPSAGSEFFAPLSISIPKERVEERSGELFVPKFHDEPFVEPSPGVTAPPVNIDFWSAEGINESQFSGSNQNFEDLRLSSSCQERKAKIDHISELDDFGSLWQLLDDNLKPKMPNVSIPFSKKIFNEHRKLAHQLLVTQEEIVFLNQKKARVLQTLDEQTAEEVSCNRRYTQKIEELKLENTKLTSTRQSLSRQLETLKSSGHLADSGYIGMSSSAPDHSSGRLVLTPPPSSKDERKDC